MWVGTYPNVTTAFIACGIKSFFKLFNLLEHGVNIVLGSIIFLVLLFLYIIHFAFFLVSYLLLFIIDFHMNYY